MRKSITLRAFPAGMKTLERVEMARRAGYQGVEVNLEPAEEYTLDSSERELAALRKEIEARGMVVSAVYCREQWRYPISSQDASRCEQGRQIIEQLVRAAPILGTDTVLVVPGVVDNSVFVDPPEVIRYDLAYSMALSVIGELARTVCEQYQVCLALENVWGKFLLSPLEFARFIDAAGSRWVGAYFDVGNVLRTGYPEHWIPSLGQRIKRVHFKDFRQSVGNLQGFVNLLEGDVNWPAVRSALEEIGYDSWVTAEVLPAYRFHGERLVRETSASIDAILGIER
ncbi:MAG TPA: sugar phosphate isomerase/epimerase family protein [Chloroflexia bacterium]|nr:sugar phosphate isomerase/epimerase family protein [Chloroflexia bacterium]